MSSTVVFSRRNSVLVIVMALLAALSGVLTFPAPAANTAPVRVVIDSITSSQVTLPSGVPDTAKPYVLVEAGGTIRVSVSFLDAAGQPAAFTKDTKLVVSSDVGTLVETAGLALKGETSAYIDTRFRDPVNRVVLTVSAGTGPKAPSPGQSYDPVDEEPDLRFDVLTDISELLPAPPGSAFEEGFGGESGCLQATEAAPVCEVVRLPRGAESNVLLTVGPCDANTQSTYAPCVKGPKGVVGGAVVQALFGEPSAPDEYSTTAPATVIIKCDKTLCGTGPIRARTVLWALGGNDALEPADACPAKGTMAQAGRPCVDFVSSTRDGSGDTHYYLLTDGDIRTGIG